MFYQDPYHLPNRHLNYYDKDLPAIYNPQIDKAGVPLSENEAD